jgi:hypothetical protein
VCTSALDALFLQTPLYSAEEDVTPLRHEGAASGLLLSDPQWEHRPGMAGSPCALSPSSVAARDGVGLAAGHHRYTGTPQASQAARASPSRSTGAWGPRHPGSVVAPEDRDLDA